ncbi:MAG: peptidylprolyl isomerase [Saprospiraceae bacterium]|nr:peptidylprolyl isomerase [Saprospiraceae bacterium]
MKQEAGKLGLGVSRTELLDLQFGPRPSPLINQRFADPDNPGVLNREQLDYIKNIIQENRVQEAIDQGQLLPSFIPYWKHQEKEIIKERLQAKINSLVSKGLYTPSWMAEMGFNESSETADFTYVKVPFDEIPNTDVSLSDSDYEAFLKENEAKYRVKEEMRRVEYVVFDIAPTVEDSTAAREKISGLLAEFQSTTDDSSFVLRNAGTIDAAYVKKADLSPTAADTIMKLAKGSVFGPYIDGGYYKAVKMLDKKIIPDSVRSRHILRQATNPMELAQAQKTIDSLKLLIENGTASFDSLAARFGTDATRTKGGDLGYTFAGGMVKPFNDLIFYEAEQGKLYTVETQFGIHLVEVTGKKFINNTEAVKVAYLQEQLVPSDDTQAAIYEKASGFAFNNRKLSQLEEAAKKDPSLRMETSAGMDRNAFAIGDLGVSGDAREIVRWAFSAKAGEVSSTVYAFRDPVAYYNNKYVVVGLKDIQKPGLPSVASAKTDIEQLVINRKKAELIKERIKGQDMNAVASTYNVQPDTAYGVTFAQSFVQNLGNEPAVVGTLFTLDSGKTSEPIAGETGVFVLNVTRRNPPAGDAGVALPQLKMQLTQTARQQIPLGVMTALKNNAKIKDNRAKFY